MSDDDDPAKIRLSARNLRGIAHPVRVRILGLLRTDGPATATTLASRLGMNTGATSYHLRQLAEYGFVEDVPARGNRRERWWRAVHRSTVFSEDELVADDPDLGTAYLRAAVQALTDNMLRAVDALPTLPKEWRAAQNFSDYLFTLTPAQAEELTAEIHGVLRRYQAADPQTLQERSAGTARVTFQFQMFPHPEDLSPPGTAATADHDADDAAGQSDDGR